MTGLWIAIALLVIAVLGLLLPPLLRRHGAQARRADFDLTVFEDQLKEVDRDLERGLTGAAEADSARLEIQRRMLAVVEQSAGDEDARAARTGGGRTLAILLGGLVPLFAILLYLERGHPNLDDFPASARAVAAENQAAGGRTAGEHPVSGAAGDMASMVAKLAEKLEAQPDNPEGWMLLGRSYVSMDRYAEAAEAYRRAWDQTTGEEKASVGIEYGEAIVLREDGVPMEAAAMFIAGREVDPTNPKPRFYLARQKAEMGNFKAALQDFVDMRAIGPADAPWMPLVERMIAQTAKDAGLDPAGMSPSEDALRLAAAQPAPEPAPAAAPVSEATGPTQADVQAAGQMSEGERNEMIRSMVQRLADRLKENPNDADGWERLSRAYRVLGEMEKSAEAAAKAQALRGN